MLQHRRHRPPHFLIRPITSIEEAGVKRQVIILAARSVLLSDHSKWDMSVPIYFAGWDCFEALVTDRPPPAAAEGFKPPHRL
jgi:DeoR/GlpR family transcriptional regulator of sugar metabolism